MLPLLLSVRSRWSYLLRTAPTIDHLLHPLEDMIRTKLIPALAGRVPPNNGQRDLLALPSRLGGIGLINSAKLISEEYEAFIRVTSSLTRLILEQDPFYSFEVIEDQINAKAEVHTQRCKQQAELASFLKTSLSSQLSLATNLAPEKGTSHW